MRYDPHDNVHAQHHRYFYELTVAINAAEQEEECSRSWFSHPTKYNSRIQTTGGQDGSHGSVFETNNGNGEMCGKEMGACPQLAYTCIMLFVFLMVYFSSPRFYPIETTPTDQILDAATRLFPGPSTAECIDRGMNSTPLHTKVSAPTPLPGRNSGSDRNDTTAAGNVLPNQTGCVHTVRFVGEDAVVGRVLDRPDIKSFLFDLGGTSCACKLQWDSAQYWQRVLYGVKYVQPHVMTAFVGVLMSHRWQWVLLYKFLNEILEELALPVFGKWAMVDAFADTESRYDSLVNDCLLSAIPFTVLGCHFVYALELPDPIPSTLEYDIGTGKTLVVVFLQYFLLNNVNNFFDKFGNQRLDLSWLGVAADVGKACTLFLQICTLAVIWWMKKWLWSKLLCTVFCLVLIWMPFVLYSIETGANEQIAAMLSLALAGFVTCYYQVTNTHKTCNRYLLVWCACWYAASFIVYCQLVWSAHPWISPPVDTFRYQRGSCGMNSGSYPQYINTCAAVF